jgi:NitT/TauT family transport system substrate-binding protein
MDSTRREFVRGLTLGGTMGLLGVRPQTAGAEPPPETTKLVMRRPPSGGFCIAPLFVAEELLKAEGFTDIQYIKKGYVDGLRSLASGETQMDMAFAGQFLRQIDAGEPVVVLSGIHVGCFELFATDRVRTVRDLKGKRISVTELGSGRHLFVSAAMAYVGLDPQKDVTFVRHAPAESIRLLAEGKIDAYQAFAEEVYELRAKKIGRSILNGTTDRPWSQYFCCVVAANKDFVRNYPVAAKRALRAFLKASSVCSLEPDRAARLLVDKGYSRQSEDIRQMFKELRYTMWRDVDAEDTLRFYAVRLHEAGMVKAAPAKLISQGTDWRFLNELKAELKG